MNSTRSNTKSAKKSSSKPSVFKKVNAFLHLWLGLASGIIIVIVSITGAVYVFEKEIRSVTEPWSYVQPAGKVLPPSALINIARGPLGDMQPTGLTYGSATEAATVSSSDRKKGLFVRVFINPYTGKVLKKSTLDRKGSSGDFDFFRFVLNGHRALWLPYNIGRLIVGVAILIFVFMLISGLVLWWPKKWIRSIRDKSFKIKWKASFKRVNYDLHNVLGFYACLLLLIISLTGLIWSFQWVSRSLYWATSGGRSLTGGKAPVSDTTAGKSFMLASIDQKWNEISVNDKPEGFFISIPRKKADVIEIIAYLRAGTFYKTNVYQYDQFTLLPLKATGPFSGKYADAAAYDKLRRMNYDIHTGGILGIPGKVIAFFAALISASLPITGFYIWWGKRKKKKPAKVGLTQLSANDTPPVPSPRKYRPAARAAAVLSNEP